MCSVWGAFIVLPIFKTQYYCLFQCYRNYLCVHGITIDKFCVSYVPIPVVFTAFRIKVLNRWLHAHIDTFTEK